MSKGWVKLHRVLLRSELWKKPQDLRLFIWILLNVDAKTAPPTSPVPRTVAVTRSSPSSRHRKMLSSTTIELSTNIPIPSARPPRDMIFNETPNMFIGAKVATIEIGMARPTMRVLSGFRRKM